MFHASAISEETVSNNPSAATIRFVAPVLGVLTAAWVIVYGLVLDAPGMPGSLLALLPAALLVLWVGIRAHDRSRTWVLAMMPVAVGIIAVTVLVGTFVLSSSAAVFWVAGALASALPFFAVARGIRD